jgi:cellulose synthase/poly-beta-1,6-N-acetylglucosamine synthase-like glycosyltransferase
MPSTKENMTPATLDAIKENLAAMHVKVSEHLGGHAFRDDFLEFHTERPETEDPNSIAVCLPMFNEDEEELQETLRDLALMQRKLGSKQLKVCVIQDGWKHIDSTSRAMFVGMYPTPAGQREWAAEVDALEEVGAKLTLIFPPHTLNCRRNADLEPEPLNLDVTVILKVDNRKKHNSHDLFFRGFAAHYHTELAFATDCGTKFDSDCLKGLVSLMERDAHCIAATGRQRVMTKWQQPGCEAESAFGSFLRAVQGYDYEASTVVFNGCFSLFGCLPVIPGPCGLFRLGPLLDGAFDFYADAARRAEETKTMLDGNTLLAEDRVLTYAALFLTPEKDNKPWTVRWDKRSIFYFQSETSLRTLVSQRRRWLNGTIAAYVYVVGQLGSHFGPDSTKTMAQKIRIRFLQVLNYLMLWIYLGIGLGPALYAYLSVSSFRYLLHTQIEHDHYVFSITFGVLMFAVYLGFQWRHHFVPFDATFFMAASVLNAAAAAVILIALIIAIVVDRSWMQWAGLFYVFLPILLNAMIPDFSALKILLNPVNWIAYMLFMPTMQGYFLSLAIARTFDLSWGNRAGVGQESEALKNESRALIVAQNVLNVVLMGLTFHFNSELTKPVDYVLGSMMLTPTVLISVFSMIQALGWTALVVIIILESPIVALCFFDVPARFHSSFFDSAVHFTKGYPIVAVFAGAILVLTCKAIGISLLRLKTAYADRGKAPISSGACAREPMIQTS